MVSFGAENDEHLRSVSFLYSPTPVASSIDLHPLYLLGWPVSCTVKIGNKKANRGSVRLLIRRLMVALVFIVWAGSVSAIPIMTVPHDSSKCGVSK